MLSQEDRRRLQDIESHLEQDDPAFGARMRFPLARRRVRLLFTANLTMWVAVPLVGATAGWVIAAAVVPVLTLATVTLWWRLPRNGTTATDRPTEGLR